MSSFEIHTMFGRAGARDGPCAAAAGTMPTRIVNARSDRRVRWIIASDFVKRYAYRPAGKLPRLRRQPDGAMALQLGIPVRVEIDERPPCRARLQACEQRLCQADPRRAALGHFRPLRKEPLLPRTEQLRFVHVKVGALDWRRLELAVLEDGKAHAAEAKCAVVDADALINWRRIVRIRIVATLRALHDVHEISRAPIAAAVLIALRRRPSSV